MIAIKGSKGYLVALESIAMTDIVLNLFIFFFISFSLLYTLQPDRMTRIEVRLPKASSSVALEGAEKAVIAIQQNGKYFLNDVPVQRRALKKTLKERLGRNRDLGVLFRIDSRARFDNVAFALDVVNDLGIRKVSIGAIKESP